MPLDMTFVVHVRAQFGDDDIDVGVFVGREKSWSFDCPAVAAGHALLLFQSAGVFREQTLQINGVNVYGGIPDTLALNFTTPPLQGGVPPHIHSLTGVGVGWSGNVLIINSGTLKATDNILRVASDGANFIIDNVVVLYRTLDPARPGRVPVAARAE